MLENSLLEPEFQTVYNDWKYKQTPESRAAISHALLPVIKQTIQATNGDPANQALLAKGRMMAVQSLKRYDPMKAKLKNFMYSQLMGLNRVIGNSNNIIQIPEGVILDKNKVSRAESELTDKLGRAPSSSEVADYTGLSLKRLAKLRNANLPLAESQMVSPEGEAFSPRVTVIGDTSRQDAWMNYVYDSCDNRKRAIMERVYGLNGFKPMSGKDIAKELNITPAAISQQRKKIDEMLDSDDQYEIFKL